MAGISVAAEWQLLHNRYYRKPLLYTMQWNQIDLTRHKIACAPFAGPIAIIRDESKIVPLHSESALRKLRIFTSSGLPISESTWRNPRLLSLSWTQTLTLTCLTQTATLYTYNLQSELISTVSLDCGGVLLDAVFYSNGFVCLNESFEVYSVGFNEGSEVRSVRIGGEGIGLTELPHCVAVIEGMYTESGDVEVLVGVGDNVLLLVEEEESGRVVGEGVGTLLKMVVSRNGEFVASFTSDGRLLVMDSGFTNVIIEYDCETTIPPEQIAWCGLDSVLLYWDDMLLMVGPYGDPVRYIYDEPIILIPECDGVRILSNTSMEFLHRVPESTVSIFQIGGTSPAALLYDALDHFDRRSAKADENLRLIRSSLPEAVEACVDAAGYEFDITLQRTLLRAASYGQAFSSHFQRDSIQEMCKTLRVLNAVRHVKTGIPLSIQQYKLLTPSVLINRLINAHKHLVALRISEYLGMNQEVVLMHWTCTKISTSMAVPDDALFDILVEKLNICKGISYAAVAAHADKSGRRKLSAMLVEKEPRSSKQIPLLLSIGEDDNALTKATQSGDTDLVYLVLFHIWRKRSTQEFFDTIRAKPVARDLFITYARCYKPEFLKDFFLYTLQFQDVAVLLWKESWELAKIPIESKGSPLHGPRIKLIEKAAELFARPKEKASEHMFEHKAAEEHAKLLRMQYDFEKSTKQALFAKSSISDTIQTCINLGMHKEANRVKTEFKVPEKRWYWLKVNALARLRDWDALEKFSKEKRPPMGYRPFVKVCVKAGERSEALKYIPKLADPREKAEAYAKIGMAKEAADAATQSKDSELLGRLKQSFSQNASASSIFDTLRDRLSFPGVS